MTYPDVGTVTYQRLKSAKRDGISMDKLVSRRVIIFFDLKIVTPTQMSKIQRNG